jgi:hypothetical protein
MFWRQSRYHHTLDRSHPRYSVTHASKPFPKSPKATHLFFSRNLFATLLDVAAQLQPLTEAPYENTDTCALSPLLPDGMGFLLQPNAQTFFHPFPFQATSAFYQWAGNTYTPHEVARMSIQSTAFLRQYIGRDQRVQLRTTRQAATQTYTDERPMQAASRNMCP